MKYILLILLGLSFVACSQFQHQERKPSSEETIELKQLLDEYDAKIDELLKNKTAENEFNHFFENEISSYLKYHKEKPESELTFRAKDKITYFFLRLSDLLKNSNESDDRKELLKNVLKNFTNIIKIKRDAASDYQAAIDELRMYFRNSIKEQKKQQREIKPQD